MITKPIMLVEAATTAGISVPNDVDEYDSEQNREDYPHFYVFCQLQLGKPMRDPGEHWENAKVVASVPKELIREVTIEDLLEAGFSE